ncbi:hypothetical protein [Andreprevotia chitinilytica]|uniref:hypothetical protein n=1 Tax=Andreprevotia chitinilytica TaxID=396808 RepID=UPI00068D5331|nr:hypothetical protein [Andreprevotia chitinilytica]
MSLPLELSNTVFAKTAKGQEEVDLRNHGLSPRLRRVLILIDGARTIYMLTTMLAGLELAPMLRELSLGGFITANGPDLAAAFAISAKPMQPPVPQATRDPIIVEPALAPQAIDPVRLEQVKRLMSDSAREFLGLMASSLVADIDAAADSVRLKAVVGRWNMALRESRKAAPYADEYMTAVKTLIHL